MFGNQFSGTVPRSFREALEDRFSELENRLDQMEDNQDGQEAFTNVADRVHETEQRLKDVETDTARAVGELQEQINDLRTILEDVTEQDDAPDLELPRLDHELNQAPTDVLLPVDENDPGANAQQTDRALATLVSYLDELVTALERGEA